MIRALVSATPFVTGLAAFAAPGDFPPPIEPAEQGKLQCYSPDEALKTCKSMAAYRITADGGFENPASIPIPTFPPMTMEIVSAITIRSGEVCGFIRKDDIARARFLVGDLQASPEITDDFRNRAAILYAPVIDHEICTAYYPDGDGLIARATMDGVRMPGPDQHVIWVSPSDGYHVAS